ncbi:MAG: sensor histidine kinase, partial [Bacteroidetes bacterium]
MNNKLPSSILISLYLSVVLTLGYGLLGYAAPFAQWDTPYHLLVFFIFSFVSLVAALEWFVFRKLKNLQILNEREIRKLKDMETYRREFLGEVSHELKTPIFAIQGFIHTLIEGAVNDERVRMKFLKKAMKNSDRLSNLVEDLLIITQAESGEMEMRIRKFGIYELVRDTLDSLEYKFTKKKRNVAYHINANGLERAMVLADRERIQQVLTNLVDNAIKYGDQEGEVEISLEDAGEKILVHVKDRGPGIEEEHLDKIFRRFYRVDKSRSRDKGGTGLGLSICKHLMEAHGEKVWAKSEVGKGTTFSF